MNSISYQQALGTIIFDEDNRMPLGIVEDLVINTGNFKVEGLIIKSNFFKRSKVMSTSSISSWGKDIHASSYSLKEIEESIVIKNILEKEIGIIWNKVEDESSKKLGRVVDFFFTRTTFQGISILVKSSFFGLFYFGKGIEISKNDILDVTKDKIIVKNLNLVKA